MLFVLWIIWPVPYLFVHKIRTQICILWSAQPLGSFSNLLIFSEWLKAHFKKHGFCTYSCTVLMSLSLKREEKFFYKLEEVKWFPKFPKFPGSLKTDCAVQKTQSVRWKRRLWCLSEQSQRWIIIMQLFRWLGETSSSAPDLILAGLCMLELSQFIAIMYFH